MMVEKRTIIDNVNYLKHLKQSEQKLENIKEICDTYQMEYIVNNRFKLLITKILQIIGDE